jgi:hypothetical protein
MDCPRCNLPTQDQANFCGNCGFDLKGEEPVSELERRRIFEIERLKMEARMELRRRNRRPVLAGLLSFLIPGLGHLYFGMFFRGCLIFVLCLASMAMACIFAVTELLTRIIFLSPIHFLFMLLPSVIWIYGVWSAYSDCKRFTSLGVPQNFSWPQRIGLIIIAEMGLIVLFSIFCCYLLRS